MNLRERYPLDYCWLRKEITLPERMVGQPVSGPAKLLLTASDYGYLWVNGESKGSFPWNMPSIPTKEPGKRH